MKKIGLIILFLMLAVFLSYSLKPTKTRISTYSITSGTGVWDTTTILNVVLDADSTGIMLEVNKDSVSGIIKYQYTSPNGYSNNVTVDNAPPLDTFDIGEQGVFTYSIPIVAGIDRVSLYILTKNEKSTSQTITNTLYTVKWR